MDGHWEDLQDGERNETHVGLMWLQSTSQERAYYQSTAISRDRKQLKDFSNVVKSGFEATKSVEN